MNIPIMINQQCMKIVIKFKRWSSRFKSVLHCNVTKIYKIAVWIVFATVFTVAVLSAVSAFAKTMNWNILAMNTVKMTTIAGEYIYSVLDYIAIVGFDVFLQLMTSFKIFILLWISILGHQEFGNLKRSDWQRFSH